jgi:hypothetical protein
LHARVLSAVVLAKGEASHRRREAARDHKALMTLMPRGPLAGYE